MQNAGQGSGFGLMVVMSRSICSCVGPEIIVLRALGCLCWLAPCRRQRYAQVNAGYRVWAHGGDERCRCWPG